MKVLLTAVMLLSPGCGGAFLEVTPNGELDEAVLATNEGVDALLIGAYSMMDGVDSDFSWGAATSGWLYASIRGMDANIGTDAGDSYLLPVIQNFHERPDHPYLNEKWRSVYESVSRCNRVLIEASAALDRKGITDEEYLLFYRQARALRGFYHFEAFRMWGDRATGRFVPFIDEFTDPNAASNLDDIRDRIIEDLEMGTLLPLNMEQPGRFNKSVCQVLLAKALMQMYNDYATALPLLAEVAENGTNPAGQKAGLEPRFGDVFDIEFRNGIESIYTVQYSVNDGSGGFNGGYGEVLNFPYKTGASPAGCCGMFQPTQDLVNSFRTDEQGLPFLNSYNDFTIPSDQGVSAGPDWDANRAYVQGNIVTAYDPAEPYISRAYRSLTDGNMGNDPVSTPDQWELLWTEDHAIQLDPRLDWTVGRRGIPYWDWGIHTGSDWVREQSHAGPYSPKKQVYKKSQEGIYTETGNWTSGFTANGYRLIRYADVLLLKAECEAMTGSDDMGLGEVNAVRNRAANPEGFVTEEDGITPAANYRIGNYGSSWGSVDPLTAIKFERKLELGMEGHRYFDLQRWDAVVPELSRILAFEKTMEWGDSMYGSAGVGVEDVNYPVPQRQIDLSHGRLVQNR